MTPAKTTAISSANATVPLPPVVELLRDIFSVSKRRRITARAYDIPASRVWKQKKKKREWVIFLLLKKGDFKRAMIFIMILCVYTHRRPFYTLQRQKLAESSSKRSQRSGGTGARLPSAADSCRGHNRRWSAAERVCYNIYSTCACVRIKMHIKRARTVILTEDRPTEYLSWLTGRCFAIGFVVVRCSPQMENTPCACRPKLRHNEDDEIRRQ